MFIFTHFNQRTPVQVILKQLQLLVSSFTRDHQRLQNQECAYHFLLHLTLKTSNIPIQKEQSEQKVPFRPESIHLQTYPHQKP